MAITQQIEANRRNARNSTGPRSTSGKKRASQNAFRHGLTKRIASAEFDREVETLTRQIAGDTENKTTIELARSAAEGELELARVRRVRANLIERVAAFGRFDPTKFYQTSEYEDHYSKLVEEFGTAPFSAVKPAADLVPAMSSREPQRTAEGCAEFSRNSSGYSATNPALLGEESGNSRYCFEK